MVSNETPHQTTQTIEESLNRIKNDIPQLSGIVDAFRDLLINGAIAQSELPIPQFVDEKVDRLRFSQGIPMLHERKNPCRPGRHYGGFRVADSLYEKRISQA